MTVTPNKVGIIGAGTMGTGIALAFASAGFDTILVDANPEALARGQARIRGLLDEAVARQKVDAATAAERFKNVVPAESLGAVADCALVIEAVYEDLALKCRLAASIGALCSPGTVLASNTSSLDINAMAQASGRPNRFVGMHFFSPAHIMKLVEVIRGAGSTEASVDLAVRFVRSLGKTPVVCGVGFGFIGNRIAEPYLREAEALVLEGAAPEQIDAAAQDRDLLGMAMGPCRMMDLAGLDIGASIIAERAAVTNLMDDPSYRAMARALTDRGDLGQKTGRGFYRYEGRTPIAEPATIALAEELAARHGIARRTDMSDDEILQRLLYPLINEGFEVLREGIAASEADIDTVFTAGFGFPQDRGGPMAMARAIGPSRILSQLEAFARQRGNAFGYWTPSPLLVEQARQEESAK